LKSLVFPRNQFNEEYISAAKKSGIKVVRSNPDVWFWKEKFSNIAPLARAWDTLFPINKTLTFNDQLSYVDNVLLLPASRFLRAYTAKEKSVQQLKMNRIKAEMLYAAKNDRYYHLWWHPHNFGNAVKENLYYLEEVLIYFKDLNRTYDFPSMSMIEMHDNLAGKK